MLSEILYTIVIQRPVLISWVDYYQVVQAIKNSRLNIKSKYNKKYVTYL